MCVAFLALAGCASPTKPKVGQIRYQPSQYTSQTDEKFAASPPDFINDILKNDNVSDSQRAILQRALQHGGKVSISYCESAWSDYKTCMTSRGYKEIKLIKFPNGL